ncbi:MAG: P-loop NTPase [Candidatus Methylomirabilales bacterium]
MAIPEREFKEPYSAALQLDEPETLKRLKALMAPVEFKVAVTGTKPGIGVSTFTLNLALALRHANSEGLATALQRTPTIGILDLGGSTFPQRLGGDTHGLERRGPRFRPARGPGEVKVVSMDMLMGGRFREGMAGLRDWNVVQGSLGQVDWEELNLLLIEFPSGIEAVEDLSEVLPPIDAALIVTRPGEGERERIRRIWRFFDANSISVICLVSNMEGRFTGEDVEDLGQTFGIPIRVGIPYDRALARVEKGTEVSRIFFDLSEDLVDYLVWLHDEHEDEEEF